MKNLSLKCLTTVATSTIVLFSHGALADSKNTSDNPTNHCKSYKAMAEQSLPREVGDTNYAERLLSVKIEYPQLSQRYLTQRALEVLGDTSQAKPIQTSCPATSGGEDGEEINCAATGMKISYEVDRGKVKYLNPERSFQANNGKNNKIDKEQAMQITLGQLAEIGIPHEEFNSAVDVRSLMVAGNDQNHRNPTRLLAEQAVLVHRQIQDVPVFDSYAKTAISAQGQIARLRITWPDFELQSGLSSKYFKDRSGVVESLSTELSSRDETCELFTGLNSYIAYVPGQALDERFSLEEGNNADGDENEEGSTFVPALVIYAEPRTPKEDSGEVSSPGQQFVLPLFGT